MSELSNAGSGVSIEAPRDPRADDRRPDARRSEDGRLRVLHVVEAFGGGVYEMVRVLCERLACEEHTVGLAYGVRPETPPDVEATLDPRIEQFAMPWTQRSLGANLRAYEQVRRLVREWRPDVVHLHSSFAGAVGAAAVGPRYPTVYTPHGYSFTVDGSRTRQAVYRGVERVVARRVSAVGAISHSEAALANDLGTAQRVITIPNGISELDHPARAALDLDRPALVVAMGRVMAQRQPERVAEIMCELDGLAEMEWIGGGRVGSRQVERLESAGVSLTGWLPREEALARLCCASVYIHWTAWDGHPLSVLEAMAHNVVVVASDIPANREILGARQVFQSTSEAISFVRRVLSDRRLRAELLAEQRERCRCFSADIMTESWLSAYRSLTSGFDERRRVSTADAA